MNEVIKIAWRNLWRNKRRTIITASSIFFAIWFAVVMRSFQLGTYNHMIHLIIESYTGYLQVQNADYYDDPSIDNAFMPTTELMEAIRNTPNVKVAVPRIESFGLASTGSLSKGVIVAGISTEVEKFMSNPQQKLIQTDKIKSRYLSKNDDGILVSYRLSQYLKAGIGDTVVLMGQGYQGVSAAKLFPIRGIVKIPSIELDNKLIYMTIEQASEFYSLEGKITSIAINLYEMDEMKQTQTYMRKTLKNKELTIRNWEEVTPTLKQQIEGDSKSGQVFIAVLYVIIFFGIYGTVQMMISERKREFGVMVAIGMKRGKLAAIVTLEMLFLGLIGIVSGMLAAVPVILYGYYFPFRMTGEIAQMYMDYGFDPIMPLAWFGQYFFNQGLVVFLMVLIASLFPMKSILRINIIKSIHGN